MCVCIEGETLPILVRGPHMSAFGQPGLDITENSRIELYAGLDITVLGPSDSIQSYWGSPKTESAVHWKACGVWEIDQACKLNP